MEPNIREATASDAAWFVENVRSLVAEPGVQVPLRAEEFLVTPDQQAKLFYEAHARGDLFLIAEIDGVRVGELNLRRSGRAALRHSAVLGIAVTREWRNKRVGTALMRAAITWAKTEGTLRRIELYVFSTNLPAIRLYERHGFVVEGRRSGAIRVEDAFIDDLLMAHFIR